MHIPSCQTNDLDILEFEPALTVANQPSADYDIAKWLYVPNFYSEYRYILGTRGKKPLICVGINPSTAAPDALDNTLKLVERIALRAALGELQQLRAEVKVGDSRYDFCAEQDGRRVLIEVKGCTLEEDGIARFPDAPTERGVKHVRGLIEQARQGCRCIVLIVIQMKGVHTFQPNWKTHSEFGQALVDARAAGVEIVAVDCEVIPGEVRIGRPVQVDLTQR